MPSFKPGLVHALVTPFDGDARIDYATVDKLVDFHIANGADAIALPMHAGESVSLPDAEKRRLLTAAIKAVRGRVPVIAHASDSGTSIAASLARFAEEAGAAAVVSTTPYYWTPPAAMILEHFAQIAGAIRVPFYVHNAPEDMAGIKVSSDLMVKLVERAPNFAGVVDSGLDWQFMIELMTHAPQKRADFRLLTGVEYAVSAAAIGSSGMISSLAAIAPRRIAQLHKLCSQDKLIEARQVQSEIAALRQILKRHGIAGLKFALAMMGRDCGPPRPPLDALTGETGSTLSKALSKSGCLLDEPRGW